MKQFFLFFLVIFFFCLPNFSFAKFGPNFLDNLLIQEIKVKGNATSSHYGEWIEVANSSDSPVNLADFCLVSKKESDNTLASYNCFPAFDLLPQEITIVAYSGYDFLKDNQFDLVEIKELLDSGENLKNILGGYLFELGDRENSTEASFFSQVIPNLLHVSKSRLYLGDGSGEIFLFEKDTQEIKDYKKWTEEIAPDKSWARPVYNSEKFVFEVAMPSPFKIFPLFIALESEAIGFTTVDFVFNKFFEPLNKVSEKISLFAVKNDKQELVQEQNFIPEKITYSNLLENTFYILKIEAKISENIIFSSEIDFQTLAHYPIIVFNEIYPDPKINEDEFVELYNPNNFSVDLNSWSIKDKADNIFFLSGLVQPKNFIIFYPNFALNNDSEEIYLFDPNGFLKDKINYKKALNGYSYSYSEDYWRWSRLATPGKKNKIVPIYLPKTVDLAKENEDRVQVRGKIVIPPKSFASYFYIAENDSALKIKSSKKHNFNEGSCILVFGEIKKEKESYLNLENYEVLPLSGCSDINFSQIENFNNLAQLVSIESDIFSEKGNYYVNFEEEKIKLRTNNFKPKKLKARIQGVLGFGAKYLQLFILKPEWIKYDEFLLEEGSDVESIKKNQTNSEEKIITAFNLDDIKNDFSNYKDFSDQRLKNENPNQEKGNHFVWFIPYYLGFLVFGALAKALFFT